MIAMTAFYFRFYLVARRVVRWTKGGRKGRDGGSEDDVLVKTQRRREDRETRERARQEFPYLHQRRALEKFQAEEKA